MTLYELSSQFERFMAAVESGEIPEEAIADTLESMNCDIDEKIDNIACIIKNELALAEDIEQESKKFHDRAKSYQNRAESLKKYLSEQMARIGKNKFETVRNQISFRKSSQTVIEDENEFIKEYPDYCKTVVKHKIIKGEVAKALKSGAEIVGAHICEKQNIQIK